jgi:hypothetical protein
VKIYLAGNIGGSSGGGVAPRYRLDHINLLKVRRLLSYHDYLVKRGILVELKFTLPGGP